MAVKQRKAGVQLTGQDANDFFAIQLVRSSGPEKALDKVSGPMRLAVIRAIKAEGLPMPANAEEVDIHSVALDVAQAIKEK